MGEKMEAVEDFLARGGGKPCCERGMIFVEAIRELLDELNPMKDALNEPGLPLFPMSAIAFLKEWWRYGFVDGLNIFAWRQDAKDERRKRMIVLDRLARNQELLEAIHRHEGLCSGGEQHPNLSSVWDEIQENAKLLPSK